MQNIKYKILWSGIIAVTFACRIVPGMESIATVEAGLDERNDEPCVEVYRTIPAGKYTPGEPLTVVIHAESKCNDAFGSLGFTESIPEDWFFVEVGSIRGEKPSIYPEAGKRGSLDFGWINVPEFPIEFQYIIKPVRETREPLRIMGSALYYFSVGDINQSAVVETVVESADSLPSEGEAEREGETPVEIEGELNGEGEGEVIPEGEAEMEGEVSQEGEYEGENGTEGEVAREGEVEGENGVEVEGEGEEQSEVQTGCCQSAQKSLNSGFNGNSANVMAGNTLLLLLAAGCLALNALKK